MLNKTRRNDYAEIAKITIRIYESAKKELQALEEETTIKDYKETVDGFFTGTDGYVEKLFLANDLAKKGENVCQGIYNYVKGSEK